MQRSQHSGRRNFFLVAALRQNLQHCHRYKLQRLIRNVPIVPQPLLNQFHFAA